jgi:dTDP-4-amino-4,6-dideoxygalactose transaminase
MVASYVGAQRGITTVNGTFAIHTALLINDVKQNDEVISQALTFLATANAIAYVGAKAVFIDLDADTLGMTPIALKSWLVKNTRSINGKTFNKISGARIAACVPMHTFGLPCRIQEIANICEQFNIALIEDVAESLGSFVGVIHAGNFGLEGAGRPSFGA